VDVLREMWLEPRLLAVERLLGAFSSNLLLGAATVCSGAASVCSVHAYVHVYSHSRTQTRTHAHAPTHAHSHGCTRCGLTLALAGAVARSLFYPSETTQELMAPYLPAFAGAYVVGVQVYARSALQTSRPGGASARTVRSLRALPPVKPQLCRGSR
jgi:hypothetical protein